MLDPEDLNEIVDGLIKEPAIAPSDKLIRALAACCGTDAAAVRAVFEQRFRAQGHETSLFYEMPSSGSG